MRNKIKREDFPMLKNTINGRPLVYFDNAATAQKPLSVIQAVADYYKKYTANVHRSLNPLGAEATRRYELARRDIAAFINASPAETILTRGTTEGINLVVRTWGEANLRDGDIIVLSITEHHANIVPWLQLQAKIKIKIKYIPLNSDGSWNLAEAEKILTNPRVKFLSITQASNVLGLINPVQHLLKIARRRGIVSLIDAAQSVAHIKVDVQELDSDFLVFSGHKIGGPSGIGVLYGRRQILEEMPPFLGGGEMISAVQTDKFSVNELPYKFEAGTPAIEAALGLAAACRYLSNLGYELITEIDQKLVHYFIKKIKNKKFIKLIGSGANKLPIFSLSIDGVHPHDAADLLGQRGIILRAGHHCAQPLHEALHIPATLRASLSFYNTTQEIDFFLDNLTELHKSFQKII